MIGHNETCASVVKLVDTADLKSARRYVYTGSIPVGGTTNFPDSREGLKTIPYLGATMPHCGGGTGGIIYFASWTLPD